MVCYLPGNPLRALVVTARAVRLVGLATADPACHVAAGQRHIGVLSPYRLKYPIWIVAVTLRHHRKCTRAKFPTGR
jgi:hypothetical protein